MTETQTTVNELTAQVPGFLFIDHFAINVVPGQMDAQVAAYRMLGFKELHREEVASEKVREVMLQIGDGPNLIQLLEPTAPDSPVAGAIERSGGRGGFAHVAFRVKDAQAAFDGMTKAGFKIINKAPKEGSRGTRIFFVHPKSREEAPFGFLIEIVEDAHAGQH
jgi:methylmalonyl-CoA/ethylmalonyl-CoA epimerase